MFDKLIVSEPEGADFKSRRRYFITSSVVVSILFTVAVIVSIFASDYRLGATEFELVELIAPPNMMAVEPEKPRLESRPQSSSSSETKSVLPTRKELIANINQTPTEPPKGVSSTPNRSLSVPHGDFRIADTDTRGSGSGRPDQDGTSDVPSGLVASAPTVVETRAIPDPPAIKVPPPAPKPPVQSMGVVNGMASSLPKPNYPAAAKAINMQGKVDVQVLIDESGKVVSAKAISGNAMFRAAAVAAAWNARFTPTTLSKVPVKVTGVIVYNFTKG